MRTLKPFSAKEGSRLDDYTSRIGETLIRRRAELEARAARVEAELAIKARSEFLANMNHELRTPLNAIIGFATMLRDGQEYDLSNDQRVVYAEYVLQSADLLLGHINTILEVAALESGRVELTDNAIDVCVVLMDAIDRASVRANAAGVKIERRDDSVDIVGWGDLERFSQAADHLLQTAIKLSPNGGRIHVRAAMGDQNWAEIAVRDEGDGLTAEEIYSALDAFNETHRGLDRSFLGPGIGYAVAKTFVEMQGGRFSLESRKGQGTLARIALPPPEARKIPRDISNSVGADDRPVEKKYDAA